MENFQENNFIQRGEQLETVYYNNQSKWGVYRQELCPRDLVNAPSSLSHPFHRTPVLLPNQQKGLT